MGQRDTEGQYRGAIPHLDTYDGDRDFYKCLDPALCVSDGRSAQIPQGLCILGVYGGVSGHHDADCSHLIQGRVSIFAAMFRLSLTRRRDRKKDEEHSNVDEVQEVADVRVDPAKRVDEGVVAI